MNVRESSAPVLAELKDPAFWRDLGAGLHVGDAEFFRTIQPLGLGSEVTSKLGALLRVEGYFQLPPPNWRLPLDQMVALVKTLDDRKLPLPFAFIYDEFWALYFRLDGLLKALLGPGYLRLPDFWTWLVDPQRNQSGWEAHRDKGWQALFPDRSPKSLTIWIPLTNATPLNGCMYVVPADRDPVYGTEKDTTWCHKLSDVRALPAEAGSVLCWTQALLHWGSSTSRRERNPRVSVAFEFQSGEVPPMNQPLTKPNEIPQFEFRLRLIGKQILQYKHMYPLSPEIEAIALQLISPAAKAK